MCVRAAGDNTLNLLESSCLLKMQRLRSQKFSYWCGEKSVEGDNSCHRRTWKTSTLQGGVDGRRCGTLPPSHRQTERVTDHQFTSRNLENSLPAVRTNRDHHGCRFSVSFYQQTGGKQVFCRQKSLSLKDSAKQLEGTMQPSF